jgi:hypothetical protein
MNHSTIVLQYKYEVLDRDYYTVLVLEYEVFQVPVQVLPGNTLLTNGSTGESHTVCFLTERGNVSTAYRFVFGCIRCRQP